MTSMISAERATQPRAGAERAAFAGLTLAFVASRVACRLAGVRFDLRPLASSWQIIDPQLLRHDLLRSVFYTPGQPPLYNLMLGLVLKLFPTPEGQRVAFHLLYGSMSLATILLLYDLTRRLGVPRWPAFAGALLFACSPALILYESLPYYTVPVTCVLTASAWLFCRTLARFSAARAHGLCWTLAGLIYLRSLFQLPWLLVVLGFCALALRGHRRAFLAASCAPLLLVLGLYGKNLWLTGHFATSSWLGMSVIKLSALRLPRSERKRLVGAGSLSPLALSDTTYNPPEHYPERFARAPHTGIPVLDRPYKSTGHVNYHHLAYVDISQQALADALSAIRLDPRTYLRSTGEALRMFWRPASDYPFLKENRDAIAPLSRAYARLLAGQPRYPSDPWFRLEPGQVGYLIAAGHLLCVGIALLLLGRWLRGRRLDAAELVLLFMGLHVLYVSLIGTTLEIDENQRFRFYLHPLLCAILLTCAARIRRARALTPPR
jgi:hypothetical protein